MNKNAKTVSIIFNVAIILATVFAIITITYSWYNKSTNADISTISMSVSETEGILLSGNGLNWSPTLSTTGSASIDLNEDVELTSISSGGTVINGNMQFYTGEFSDNAFNTILLTESNFYYVFDFYILNNDDFDKILTLGQNSAVVSVNDKGVELSIRTAFINLGNSASSLEAIELDGTGISNVDYIWEPNSTTRHDKIALYQLSYVPEGKVSYEGINLQATGLALVNNLITDNLETPEEEVVDVTTHDPISAGDTNDITLLVSNTITKLRVFIWCEGQDIDCVNSISGGAADLNLNFNTYDAQLVEEEYVAVEKFNTPTITNTEGVTYSWSATTTNITEERYSSNYIVKISKYIESELIAVRAVNITENTININDLNILELGNYYIEVKVHSQFFADSEYSTALTFSVLDIPNNFIIIGNVASWSAVSNAESYTIMVYNQSTESTYTKTTTSLSLNLETTMFDGDIYLPTGNQYVVSIKANGNLGYANSDYSDTLNLLY